MGKYHILESQQALFLFNFDIALKRHCSSQCLQAVRTWS